MRILIKIAVCIVAVVRAIPVDAHDAGPNLALQLGIPAYPLQRSHEPCMLRACKAAIHISSLNLKRSFISINPRACKSDVNFATFTMP